MSLRWVPAALLLAACPVAVARTQGAAVRAMALRNTAPQATGTGAGVQGGGQGRGARPSPASQPPSPTLTPQSYLPEQIESGRVLFSAQCGFCHGRDAAGGESGPDLIRSALVADDVRGDQIGPIVRAGRLDKGMPAFNLSEAEMIAIVAFLHDLKTKTESQQGSRRTVEVADLQTGDAEAGKLYFNGPGRCSTCHSPAGDLAGIASRLQGLPLLQRMLYPSGRGAGAAAGAADERRVPKATVTLRDGQKVTGKLAYRDEFTIGVTDSTGWYRSWPTSQVKFTIENPIEAHIEQLARYTDNDMHDVLAYLQTLR